MRSHLKLKTALLAATVLTTAVCLHADEATTRPASDPTREPPAEFVLETPAGPVEVVADAPFDLTVAGQTVRATLRPADTKRLDVGDVSFRYPADMSFVYDGSDPRVFCWTLDGPKAGLTLIGHRNPLTLPSAAADLTFGALMNQFGDAARREGDSSLRLGGRQVTGQRLIVTLAGTRIVQEVYGVAAGEGAYVLILQDAPGEDGEPTAEMKSLRLRLDETWRPANDARR